MIWFTIVSGTGNTRQAFMLDLAALSIYVAYVLYVAIGLKADVAVCWTSDPCICRFYAVVLFFVFEKVRFGVKNDYDKIMSELLIKHFICRAMIESPI